MFRLSTINELMFIKIIVNIIILLCVLSVTHTQSTTPPVLTENGAVIGLQTTVNHTTINVFKGIPYAKPPIGDLRFRKTEPALNWNQTYVATNYGSQCIQDTIRFSDLSLLSEDCLYLNVWTPTLNTSANLSVMVWIKGTDLLLDTNGLKPSRFDDTNQKVYSINYDMSYLAHRNVVVVSFNYRLGVFGFLYGNSSEAPGNAGLWDQVMALNWTRRNIANFGGNPYDIILFGENAGSNHVRELIVSNDAHGIKNWFNKAILLSGTDIEDFGTKNAANQYNDARMDASHTFNDIIECNDDNTWINCLRNKSTLDLMLLYARRPPVTVYGDYYSLIPHSQNDAIRRGYFRKDLKLLMNHNEIEIDDTVKACPTVLFGAYIAKWQSFTGSVYQSKFTYQSAYSPFRGITTSDNSQFDDLMFLCCHSLNSVIAFNSNDNFISIKIIDLITNFAKTGDVILLNPTVYNDWPPYSVSNGYVNASYVELNPDHTRLGRVYTDRYRRSDYIYRYPSTPNDNFICFKFWDQNYSKDFQSPINNLVNVKHTQTTTTTPPVITENGAVVGLQTRVNDTIINVFKGIPYAKPPIGDLRFRKTEPALNWNQTYVATNYGSQCMRSLPSEYTILLGINASILNEDCLYLNVWTPTLNTTSNLSVMVWIYGGALLLKSDDVKHVPMNYDMSYLAQRNVVVVSFNYRFGVFGFLYGNSSEAPGNAGLWDQVMALNWTRRNIANFGGNPYDITLIGGSDGSMYASDLIVSNNTFGIRNWFNKAILLSGTYIFDLHIKDAKDAAYNFAKANARYIDTQCADKNKWIECLRHKPAVDLVSNEIAGKVHDEKRFSLELTDCTPVYNDYYSLIPMDPLYAVRDGYFRKDLKLLLNNNEMNALSDHLIWCATVMFGSFITKRQSINRRVYQTRFKYQRTKIFQTHTTADLFLPEETTRLEDFVYIFDQPLRSAVSGRVFNSTDKLLSIKMMDLITHFAKTGEALLLNPTVYNSSPPYSISISDLNVSYVELNPDPTRLGRVYTETYHRNTYNYRLSHRLNSDEIHGCVDYYDHDF